jgi:hypothetical protein
VPQLRQPLQACIGQALQTCGDKHASKTLLGGMDC